MERPRLHTEASLTVLCAAAVGAGLALALAALVAGAGLPVALLAFAGTAAFGLAADGRAETALGRIRPLR